MCAGARHRDIVEEASIAVARRREASHEGILGGGESSVGTLSAPQTKLNALYVVAGDKIHTGCIRANQGCEINQIENRSLQELQ